MFTQPYLLNTKIYTSPASLDGYVVVQSGFTQLVDLVVENTNGSTRWLQIFDGYQIPNNGDVPAYSFKLPTGIQSVFLPPIAPVTLFNGLVLACSSTGPTLTKAVNSLFITCQYV